MSSPRVDQPFVEGLVNTRVGQVPRVSSTLGKRDKWGAVKVRFGIGRMSYTVDPGLYALGNPKPDDPVFVTANYKLSFDRLRASLLGWSGWILVLDTKGINVWCAAGKGTFGTDELLRQVRESSLESIVSHKTLILPQLAGPGVAAFEVKRRSGFTVVYGPVEASDLPAFLKGNLKAVPGMRVKRFGTRERFVLVPIEVIGAIKMSIPVLMAIFLIGLFLSGETSLALNYTKHAVWAVGLGIGAGAIATPVALPWLPGRPFSLKGFTVGLVAAVVFILLVRWGYMNPDRFELYAWLCSIPAVSSYLAMNFTGASTFTSLSGVKKEMRFALPLQILGTGCGVIFWVASLILR